MVEDLFFDLVVVGGGLSGLCCAVAAARQGAKVALIQNRPVLGGNCSSEVRVVPFGASNSNVWAAETGIVHEILLADRRFNHEQFLDHGMINSIFDLQLQTLAEQCSGLSVYLNAHVFEVATDTDAGSDGAVTANGLGRVGGSYRSITSVTAIQLGSERRYRFRGRQFVDATGDGSVGFLAGADFRYGRESRAEFNENLAPLEPDDVTLGSTISMRARRLNSPAPFEAPTWAHHYESIDEIGFARDFDRFNSEFYGGFWWLELCNPFHQISDNAEIKRELQRHVLGIWDFVKNRSEHAEAAASYALDWVGSIPGKRESRRLVGDVILTERDCHGLTNWPDAVAYAGWWIDLHINGGLLNRVEPAERENVDANYKHWIRVPVHTIPLRALYSRNVGNLWLAGRCLSATHVGLGSVRVMLTLGHMGQAVGSAAAYSLQHDLTPREVADPGEPHIAQLQQSLLKNDVRIPGLRNADPLDLARGSKIIVSSEAALSLEPGAQTRWHQTGNWAEGLCLTAEALGMNLPVSCAPPRKVALFLDNPCDDVVEAVISFQPVANLWERTDAKAQCCATVQVPPRHCDWLWVDWPSQLRECLVRMSLSSQATIRWAEAANWPTGTGMQYLYVSDGGPEARNRLRRSFHPDEIRLPAYRHWRQGAFALAVRFDQPQHVFGGSNVISGRASPEDGPNLWVSDPEQSFPQTLEMLLPDPKEIAFVQVTFDTNLQRRLQSQEGFFVPPEMVKHWSLWGRSGGSWVELFTEQNNCSRFRRITVAPVSVDALKIIVHATHGDRSARIFEVRAYEQ